MGLGMKEIACNDGKSTSTTFVYLFANATSRQQCLYRFVKFDSMQFGSRIYECGMVLAEIETYVQQKQGYVYNNNAREP